MALSLQPGVAEAIRAHGAETYPNECCGALYGRDGVVTATYALPNTTEEGPRRRFLVRPQDYRDPDPAPAILISDRAFSAPSGPVLVDRP